MRRTHATVNTPYDNRSTVFGKYYVKGMIVTNMTLTAHSGSYGTPDNSLEFIRTAIEKKVKLLELDISFRSDNTPVMIHSGRPKKDEGILLTEAFDLLAAAPDIRMNLDLKSVRNIPGLEKLLEEYNLLDRAFYTGVHRRFMEKVRTTGTLPYYLNADVPVRYRKSEKALTTLSKRIHALGAIGLNTHYGNLTPELVTVLHRESLLVSVWTVNDEETARNVIACHPDNITSKKPDEIAKVIGEGNA